jgi:cell division initiation protein
LRITPLDIRNHAFRRRLSGYDREEVDAFLGMLADDVEGLIREADAMRQQAVRLETKVEELSAHEAVLQETLTTAHKLSQDLKETAVREAEALIGEAEIRGEKILDAAHRRAAKLAADIREMKNLRCRLAAAVRSTIGTVSARGPRRGPPGRAAAGDHDRLLHPESPGTRAREEGLTPPEDDLRLSADSRGVAFWIHVTPRARRKGVGGTHGDALRVAVAEPPAGGAANAACALALARALGGGRGAVELDRASRGRRKRVRIAGDADALAARLQELATGGTAH